MSLKHESFTTENRGQREQGKDQPCIYGCLLSKKWHFTHIFYFSWIWGLFALVLLTGAWDEQVILGRSEPLWLSCGRSQRMGLSCRMWREAPQCRKKSGLCGIVGVTFSTLTKFSWEIKIWIHSNHLIFCRIMKYSRNLKRFSSHKQPNRQNFNLIQICNGFNLWIKNNCFHFGH
jgi:hypothetical protein